MTTARHQYASFPREIFTLIGTRGTAADDKQVEEAKQLLADILRTLIEVGPAGGHIYLDDPAPQVFYRLFEVFLGSEWENDLNLGSFWIRDWKRDLEAGTTPRFQLMTVLYQLGEIAQLDMEGLFEEASKQISLPATVEAALHEVCCGGKDPNTLEPGMKAELLSNGFLIRDDREQNYSITARARFRSSVTQTRPAVEPRPSPTQDRPKKKAKKKPKKVVNTSKLLARLEEYREELEMSAASFARDILGVEPRVYRSIKRGAKSLGQKRAVQWLKVLPK